MTSAPVSPVAGHAAAGSAGASPADIRRHSAPCVHVGSGMPLPGVQAPALVQAGQEPDIRMARQKRALSPPDDARPAKRQRRPEASLVTLPTEMVEAILSWVPNGSVAQVTKMAFLSKSVHAQAFRMTDVKVKASRLMQRAMRLRHPAAFHDELQRFNEFQLVLNLAGGLLKPAFVPRVPLHGVELTDVLVTLALSVDRLGSFAGRGFLRLVSQLEALGGRWPLRGHDLEDRRLAQLGLDQAKYRLLNQLSWQQRAASAAGPAAMGQLFDRLCAVLDSVQSPEVKNLAAREMPLLYWLSMSMDAVGRDHFQRLVGSITDNLGCLTDMSKEACIKHLSTGLTWHQQLVDKVNVYAQLCRIVGSMSNDRAKARVASQLIGDQGLLGVAHDESGDVDAALDGLIGSIGDVVLQQSVRDAQADHQQRQLAR